MTNSNDKTLYVRVTSDVYNETLEKAKKAGLPLGKYVTMCVSKFDGNVEPIDTSAPKKKSLYCRMTQENYDYIKKEAEKRGISFSRFIVMCVAQANKRDYTTLIPKTKKASRTILCYVSEELYALVQSKSEEYNISISQYVVKCIKEFKQNDTDYPD